MLVRVRRLRRVTKAGTAASDRRGSLAATSRRGATIYAQAVVVDPLGPVLGLALSSGLAMRFGD